MIDFSLWEEFLEYARWAPSPHNVQPWKIELLSEDAVDLYYDPKRLLPDEDPDGMFMTVGFGIFIEMLSIAAKAKGYSVNIEYDGSRLDANNKEPVFFAHLFLEKNTEAESLDRELIKQRRTSRLAYNNEPISDEVVKELQSIAENFEQQCQISSDPQTVDWVVKLNKDTMFYDMNDDATRKEVGQWIRYSLREASQKRDGLWAYCMNVTSFILYIFFHARWIINLPGVNQLAGKIYLRTTKGTRTVAWLQGPVATPFDWLQSGRMLARLWLTLTKHGIGLHPFGSIITNKAAHQRLREKFNADESKNMLWLIMRLGYSEVPPQSFRLELSDILIRK